jgi:hypothetical protein
MIHTAEYKGDPDPIWAADSEGRARNSLAKPVKVLKL